MNTDTSDDSTPTRRNRRGGNRSAETFVMFATKVPPEVKAHFKAAAQRHNVSLSFYLEMLAEVDPLANGPLPEEGEGAELKKPA
ncbi:hypothetical protein [Nocardiopsis baichengensis]|uniref:hypothetical protein n=1 Tax=Nocardiopsis baichengensis TaxID=280240 RepID=UPI0012691FFD|nr:hypothetical protein [Nocardiopsis baichengensis]